MQTRQSEESEKATAAQANPTVRPISDAGLHQAGDAVDARRDDAIRIRAYFLHEARGGGAGHEVEDWLQAESQLAGAAGDALPHVAS